MRRIIVSVLAVLAVVLPFAVTATVPANAVNGFIGICQSGANYCWRDTPGGAVDIWNRDIAGDARQQWIVRYLGTISQTGCYDGRSYTGPNYGVFAFIGYNGKYMGAGLYNVLSGIFYAGDQSSLDRFSEWVWESNGALVNCGDTVQTDAFFALLDTCGPVPCQLYTDNSGKATAFQQVDPPRRHR